jgi:hypothetical protein
VIGLLVGAVACTPAQMQTWLDYNGLPSFRTRGDLEGAAVFATAFWEKAAADAEARKRAEQEQAAIVPGEESYTPGPYIDPSQVDGYPWDLLAQCEAGGNWATNTGNGYHGGLQFHPGTWRSYGGTEFAPYAYLASREQQIVVAERILASHGGTFKAWPGCRRKLGLP